MAAKIDVSKRNKSVAWTSEDLKSCLKELRLKTIGFNESSRKYGIPKPTIRRHLKGLNKYAKNGTKLRGSPTVLPEEVEIELVQKIKELDEMMFGLTVKDLKTLAYDLAVKHGVAKRFNPFKKEAGKKWYYSFMKRHPDLSLRSPEPTSMNRQKGFKRQNVHSFFEKYYESLAKYQLTPEKIYNMDETAHSTVQTPSKVISLKGKRQVGATTSAERGTNTTGIHCHSASGHFLPPMLIFKRKRMSEVLKIGAPHGTEFACSSSGWIDKEIFVEWLKHFIKSTNSSPTNVHLLLLDGHGSHTKNLDAINLARENGVVMLPFPPHTTHKIQPLDVSFFKSLKHWYNLEIENRLRISRNNNNLVGSQTSLISVNQVSSLVGVSFPKAAVMETAINGFRKTGLWPPNKNIFDSEFDRTEALVQKASDSSEETSSGESILHEINLQRSTSEISVEKDLVPEDTNINLTLDVENGLLNSLPVHKPSLGLSTQFVPVKGDGRCFFRALSIALNTNLQSVQRNQNTGEIMDVLNDLQETAQADNLRARVISFMCQKSTTDPGTSILSADMPEGLKFQTLAERILHMSDPKSMVGEMEIRAATDMLEKPIHILCDNNVIKYDTAKDQSPLLVHYIPNGDAGHYEGVMAAVDSLTPSHKQNPNRGKKIYLSTVITDSPYKKDLEDKAFKPVSVKKKKCITASKKPRKRLYNTKESDSDCLVCGEPFSKSRPGEEWVQCMICSGWSHVDCTMLTG